jgi:hypothetical protein
MFDWPVATVLLGTLGTIAVGILKLVPQRMVVENSKGEKCASSEDVKNVYHAVMQVQKYLETRNHDIIKAVSETGAQLREKIEPIGHDLAILVDRSNRRGGRASHDEDN